jgi:hypothetical protein
MRSELGVGVGFWGRVFGEEGVAGIDSEAETSEMLMQNVGVCRNQVLSRSRAQIDRAE